MIAAHLPPPPAIGASIGVVANGRETSGVVVKGSAAAGKVCVEFRGAGGKVLNRALWWRGARGALNRQHAFPLHPAASHASDASA